MAEKSKSPFPRIWLILSPSDLRAVRFETEGDLKLIDAGKDLDQMTLLTATADGEKIHRHRLVVKDARSAGDGPQTIVSDHERRARSST